MVRVNNRPITLITIPALMMEKPNISLIRQCLPSVAGFGTTPPYPALFLLAFQLFNAIIPSSNIFLNSCYYIRFHLSVQLLMICSGGNAFSTIFGSV
jgi:hypothetical protein